MSVIPFLKPIVDKVIKKRKPRSGFPFKLRERKGCYEVEIRRKGVKDFRKFPEGTPKPEAIKWGYKQVEKIDNYDMDYIRKEELVGWTLGKLLDEFIEASKSPTGYFPDSTTEIRKSIGNQRKNIAKFLKDHKTTLATKPFVGPNRLCQADFKIYMGKLLGAGKSTGTVNRYVNDILTAIDKYGRECKNLPIPDYRIEAGRKLKLVREQPKYPDRVHTLSEKEYKLLRRRLRPWYSDADDPRLSTDLDRRETYLVDRQWWLLIELALETGVRLGGLLKIRWKDIDWHHNRYEQPPDKKSPKRWLPLSHARMKDLWEYKQEIPEACRQPNHTIFYVTRGPDKFGPMKPGASSNYFREKICVQAGLVLTEGPRKGKNSFAFHMLRHTSKTWLRMKYRLDADEIKYMAGNKIDRYLDHMEDPEVLSVIRAKIDPHGQFKTIFTPEATSVTKVLKPDGTWVETSKTTWVKPIVED